MSNTFLATVQSILSTNFVRFGIIGKREKKFFSFFYFLISVRNRQMGITCLEWNALSFITDDVKQDLEICSLHFG